MKETIEKLKDNLVETCLKFFEASGAERLNFEINVGRYGHDERLRLEYQSGNSNDCCCRPACTGD